MDGGYSTRGKEVTFIRKTLEVLDQYEKFMPNFEPDERHELTLDLNCLLGLIVIPQQSMLKGYTIVIENQGLWGIDLSQIRFYPSLKSTKHIKNSANEIACHLKNSLTHNKFEILCEDGENVTHVLFKDFARGKKPVQTFEYKFAVVDLLKFVKKYYEHVEI